MRYMDISVTEFKQRCLAIIRTVERTGAAVRITRRGRVVAQLGRSGSSAESGGAPWERLRAVGGRLLAAPEESVLEQTDFEALR
jgi:antitoxin (DNA-binding transcriptional repressor) of toxin-antitoxin stability system